MRKIINSMSGRYSAHDAGIGRADEGVTKRNLDEEVTSRDPIKDVQVHSTEAPSQDQQSCVAASAQPTCWTSRIAEWMRDYRCPTPLDPNDMSYQLRQHESNFVRFVQPSNAAADMRAEDACSATNDRSTQTLSLKMPGAYEPDEAECNTANFGKSINPDDNTIASCDGAMKSSASPQVSQITTANAPYNFTSAQQPASGNGMRLFSSSDLRNSSAHMSLFGRAKRSAVTNGNVFRGAQERSRSANDKSSSSTGQIGDLTGQIPLFGSCVPSLASLPSASFGCCQHRIGENSVKSSGSSEVQFGSSRSRLVSDITRPSPEALGLLDDGADALHPALTTYRAPAQQAAPAGKPFDIDNQATSSSPTTRHNFRKSPASGGLFSAATMSRATGERGLITTKQQRFYQNPAIEHLRSNVLDSSVACSDGTVYGFVTDNAIWSQPESRAGGPEDIRCLERCLDVIGSDMSIAKLSLGESTAMLQLVEVSVIERLKKIEQDLTFRPPPGEDNVARTHLARRKAALQNKRVDIEDLLKKSSSFDAESGITRIKEENHAYLQSEHSALQKTYARLQKDLSASRSQHDSVKKQSIVLKNKLIRAQSQLDDASNEQHNSQDQLRDAQIRIKSSKDELAVLRAENAELKAQKSKASYELEWNQGRLKPLEDQIKEHERTAESREQYIKWLKEQQKRDHREKSHLNDNIAANDTELVALREENAELRARLNDNMNSPHMGGLVVTSSSRKHEAVRPSTTRPTGPARPAIKESEILERDEAVLLKQIAALEEEERRLDRQIKDGQAFIAEYEEEKKREMKQEDRENRQHKQEGPADE